MKDAWGLFAANLVRLRNEAGLTQEGLAELAKTSQTAINYYETKRRRPRPAALNKLAEALNIAPADFFLMPGQNPSDTLAGQMRALQKSLAFQERLTHVPADVLDLLPQVPGDSAVWYSVKALLKGAVLGEYDQTTPPRRPHGRRKLP